MRHKGFFAVAISFDFTLLTGWNQENKNPVALSLDALATLVDVKLLI